MMNAVRNWMLGAVLVAGSVAAQASHHEKDIVDTAVGAGSFTTLVAAVQAAGLVDALKGEGPFTVLAPTDDAFAKLPEGTVETLLKEENLETLKAILLYHVIPVKAPAKVVTTLSGAETLNGQRVDITKSEDDLMVDGAKVVTADVMASNGVIHVIDTVLLPSDKNLVEVATEAGIFNTLIAAAKAADLVDPLVGKDALTVFAPTDDAFAALPEGTVESLLKPENKEKLATILKLHILPGRVYSDKAVKEGAFESLSGEDLHVKVADGKATVNGSGLVKTDIDASNGVLHVIDAVILPGSKQTSDARDLIRNAINRGAPMYNHGQVSACVHIYETVAESLVTMGDDIPQGARMALANALEQRMTTHDMSERAWILRRGLDRAMMSM